jgi:hypothetical protein
MSSSIRVPCRRVAAAAWWLFACASVPAVAFAQTIEVRVEKRDEQVVVDVQATVAVDARHAWAVLTDYDHMAQFVTNLKDSAVVARQGNSWQVEQTGEAGPSFLHFKFYSLRAVELDPGREIRSKLIRGDFKSFEFTTRLSERGGETVIVHHGEYEPTRWVPPGIGPALIKAETIKQYRELTAEMLRRQALARPPAAAQSATAPAR